ncbi:PREDICTED: cytochrome P450 83B1-like [Ipomoea nil]|uniref:cytochrome P450 83B1-like n=1 Tax=Ipomoea nil TaxID=35883 RepID=UPI000900E2E4|nr:PREDICTED: cytochrome P450 83B1-like [Ipomoea nil]XP_019196629.1 PREDICTED: cytochrome P450 83B1-like [Ipomoea nil]
MALHLFLLPAALILIYYYVLLPTCKRFGKPQTSLPGPPGLPIIGNLHQLNSAAPHVFLWKLSKKYGPLMRMKLGYRQVVVISSARMAKEALKTHDLAFSSMPSYIGRQTLSYNGLDIAFTPYGDYWREIRKIAVLHLFSHRRVKLFQPIREDEVSRMMNRISELALSSQLVNLSEIVMSLTCNIICRSAFGKNYDEERPGKWGFHKLLAESQAMMMGGSFIADYLPSFGWLDKLIGNSARLERVFKEQDSLYQELINQHLDPNRPKSMDGDILDVLISLKMENSSSVNLTWDHIKAVLMIVFVGGSDTSAAVIVWVMTALMKEPRVKNIVQSEIRDRVGKKGRIDEEDIQELPYFKAVVKETMRLYPPVPLVERETLSKCTFEGYEIKPKMLIFVNSWAIARDPACWENPHEFYPERFLDNKVDYKGQDFEFIPFGAGRRICPGIALGIASAELALANLLYAFDWELPSWVKKEDIDTNVSSGITMHKKIPLCLVAKKV